LIPRKQTQPSATAGPVKASFGGPFTLVGGDGKPFSSQKLEGKPYAIYFGFTRCGDICPTTLSRLVRLRREAFNDQAIRILFVTIDPANDGPKEVDQYAGLFNAPIIGLTGSQAQIDQVKKQYGIFAQPVPHAAMGKEMEHSASVLLFDRNGHFAGTIASGLSAPKALVEAASRYENEQRSVEFVLLDRAQAGEIPPPAPEVLAKYFEERKNFFRAPEYRKLVVVSLIPTEQARWMEISDADIKRAYEERHARYVTPERRHVLQIDFPNAEAASAAAERIAKGASFADIAKELGKNEKDIDLGTVTKAAMIDRTAADAAFALKEGEVSAPVQGRFGTVLVQVLKIEPEQIRSLEQVAGELKQELAIARAKTEVFDVYNKIEDARAEGKLLAETAATLKLEARTIEAVDRSGRDPAGMPVNLPDAQRLLPLAFTTDVGVERDPLQFQDGYIWFDVVGITPSRERPLDEVKEQVETRWRDQEIATRLNARATEIVDKLKAGGTLANVATADHLKLEALSGLKRGDASGALSTAAVDAVFRTAKDAVGTAEAQEPGEQVVFRVTEIVVPPLDMASEEVKRTVDTLNRGLSEDLLSEYIARLESEVGVTINQSALNQVVSGGAGDSAN